MSTSLAPKQLLQNGNRISLKHVPEVADSKAKGKATGPAKGTTEIHPLLLTPPVLTTGVDQPLHTKNEK